MKVSQLQDIRNELCEKVMMTKNGSAAFTFATTETGAVTNNLYFNSANAKIIQTPNNLKA